MKISLTMKNNLKHIVLVILFMTMILFVAITNARYETKATLKGKLSFPDTVLEISAPNEISVSAGQSAKLQFDVANYIQNQINNNNLIYSISVLGDLSNVQLKIRQTPETDDGMTFESLSSEATGQYTNVNLKYDGNQEDKMFDLFLKCNQVVEPIDVNLTIQIEAVSGNYRITRTKEIILHITIPEINEEIEETLDNQSTNEIIDNETNSNVINENLENQSGINENVQQNIKSINAEKQKKIEETKESESLNSIATNNVLDNVNEQGDKTTENSVEDKKHDENNVEEVNHSEEQQKEQEQSVQPEENKIQEPESIENKTDENFISNEEQ